MDEHRIRVAAPSKTSLEGWKPGILEEAEGTPRASKTSLEGWKHESIVGLMGQEDPSKTSLEGWKLLRMSCHAVTFFCLKNFLRGMET